MDSVNHPAHYNAGQIEVIEVIEDQNFGYHLGSALKYICRAGRKDPSKEIEDLEKAAWYVNRRIELLRAEKEKREPIRPNDMTRVADGWKSISAISALNSEPNEPQADTAAPVRRPPFGCPHRDDGELCDSDHCPFCVEEKRLILSKRNAELASAGFNGA